MRIKVIPIFKDNYSYLLQCTKTNTVAVIDPAEPQKVIPFLQNLNLKPAYILTTHHHQDHSGGNNKMCQEYPQVIVYGADQRVPKLGVKLLNEEVFKVGELEIVPLLTPGHTIGSVSYFVKDHNAVFTGDTLFIGGCGRFFEGSPKDMYKSLQVLSKLPKDTKVYCGHEYTIQNLEFAKKIEPDNQDLLDKLKWAKENQCTVPSTIEEELKVNPFMRVHEPSIQQKLGLLDPIEVLGTLRSLKNKF